MDDLTLIFATTTASVCIFSFFVGRVSGKSYARRYMIDVLLRLLFAAKYAGILTVTDIVREVLKDLEYFDGAD